MDEIETLQKHIENVKLDFLKRTELFMNQVTLQNRNNEVYNIAPIRKQINKIVDMQKEYDAVWKDMNLKLQEHNTFFMNLSDEEFGYKQVILELTKELEKSESIKSEHKLKKKEEKVKMAEDLLKSMHILTGVTFTTQTPTLLNGYIYNQHGKKYDVFEMNPQELSASVVSAELFKLMERSSDASPDIENI